MGNCIGKKSVARRVKQGEHSLSSGTSRTKSYCHVQQTTKCRPLYFSSSTSSSPRTSIFLSHLIDAKETDIIFNEENLLEKEIIQYSSSSSFLSRTNDQNVIFDLPTTTTLPIQLSLSSNKIFQSPIDTMGANDLNEKKEEEEEEEPIEQSPKTFRIANNEYEHEQMGHLFSKDKIENENIKVMTTSNDDTIDNDQKVPSTETMVNEIETQQQQIQESLDASPSPSLSDASLSSLSINTTSFSSQDHLILSSSPSSISSAVIISSITPTTRFRSLTYSEQIYLPDRSACFTSGKDIFSTVLPASSASRINTDPFLGEFHLNINSHACVTLSTVIDDVVQQRAIRIHRQSKIVLVENRQLEGVLLRDFKKFDTPSLIFDDQQKIVYATKHARFLGLKSLLCTTDTVARLPRLISSCDHCSSILSGSRLSNRLRTFFLANVTHNFVRMCFNETNNNTIFGYVSQLETNRIRQTIVNNSKLTYSNDLNVNKTDFYFVLRLQSWPQEIRDTFEQRQRVWPSDINPLFENTCFIRIKDDTQETPKTSKCSSCEKAFSSAITSSWSYTYAAIESQLIHLMSDEQMRFASIVWNYLNGKSQGQLSFIIFKHTLFYFFEQYPSDTFLNNDLLIYAHLFSEFLLVRFQTKFFPHYFNSNLNLYDQKLISTNLINSIAVKITYSDLKNFSIFILPSTSIYLQQLNYLIQFQSNFLQRLLSCTSSTTNSIQTLLNTHELVIKQLSNNTKMSKRQQIETMTMPLMIHRMLTLDCLYGYQEQNVQIILDYLPLLRDKEPSLLIHSLWSMFIQYFNCLFDDLFLFGETKS